MSTRRDEIFDFICDYCDEHNGPTPSIREVAQHFNLSYTTVYRHIQHLIDEKRLELRDGKMIVQDARWLPPE